MIVSYVYKLAEERDSLYRKKQLTFELREVLALRW